MPAASRVKEKDTTVAVVKTEARLLALLGIGRLTH
jgi:hypothetical protein